MTSSHISYTWLVLVCSTLTICGLAWGQIEFPENILGDKSKANAEGRVPLYAPRRCGEYELLYPGDQPNDWFCDCAPATIYHPETEKCYPAFRQAPCPDEQVFVLGRERIIPECVANTCKVDGEIPINKVCYRLGGSAPCANPELSYVLGVNPVTMLVDCVQLSAAVEMRLAELAKDAPTYDLRKVPLCGRGMKRYADGHCGPVTATKQ